MSGTIVFDFDNTLVHSRIDFAAIRRELLALLRDAKHPDFAANGSEGALTTLSIGEIIDAGAAHAPAIYDEGWRIVLEYETAGMVAATVEEDAATTLFGLRDRGFKLAVMTNNAGPATHAALDLFALRGAFDLVLTRDEVPMKPDPTGILTAMQQLGYPDRAVMIGDSWLDGVAAGRAGVPFIGFRPRTGILDERGVAYWSIVQQLGELVPLLTGPWPARPEGVVR